MGSWSGRSERGPGRLGCIVRNSASGNVPRPMNERAWSKGVPTQEAIKGRSGRFPARTLGLLCGTCDANRRGFQPDSHEERM